MRELFFPGQAAAGLSPAMQGSWSTSQTCQGTQREGPFSILVEGKEREALTKSSPFLPLPTLFCTGHVQNIQMKTTDNLTHRPSRSSFEILSLLRTVLDMQKLHFTSAKR